jgi:hypothetical protein
MIFLLLGCRLSGECVMISGDTPLVCGALRGQQALLAYTPPVQAAA